MSFYVQQLPAKKLEIIDKHCKFIGGQNICGEEIDWETLAEKYLLSAEKNKKYLICVLDNCSFDAVVVLENKYDVERFCNVDRDDDYRPHYYYLADQEFIEKWL